MDLVEASYRTEKNDTGFIYFFTKSGVCQHRVLDCEEPDYQMDDARLTLDYTVDYEVFSAIFEALYQEGSIFSLASVVRFLKTNSVIAQRNLSVEEGYWQRTAEKAVLSFQAQDGSVQRIEL